jgi:hypothetical protein
MKVELCLALNCGQYPCDNLFDEHSKMYSVTALSYADLCSKIVDKFVILTPAFKYLDNKGTLVDLCNEVCFRVCLFVVVFLTSI